MPAEGSQNMKIRLLCLDKNLKDSTVSLKERTTKSELWEVKFKRLRKISDFQMLNKTSFQPSLISSNLKFKLAIKNLKLTGKRFKN
jgi:hypothetical protein